MNILSVIIFAVASLVAAWTAAYFIIRKRPNYLLALKIIVVTFVVDLIYTTNLLF